LKQPQELAALNQLVRGEVFDQGRHVTTEVGEIGAGGEPGVNGLSTIIITGE